MAQKVITLPNGYSLQMKKEKISHVGRSIYRGFSQEQVVFEIRDASGRVTKRLTIPETIRREVARFLQ